jgi:hypothetical protein
MRTSFRRIGLALVFVTPTLFGAASVSVTPKSETVVVGKQHQMAATVTGLTDTSVVWSVNGITGGNTTVGSIDTKGLFTAPSSVPNSGIATVNATSVMDSTVSGTATLMIKLPGPVITSLSPASVPAGNISFTINGSGFLSSASAVLNNSVQNGKVMPTTVNSATKLTVTGSAAAGIYTLYVYNTNSVASNYVTFTVTASGGGGTGSGGTLTVTPQTAGVLQGQTQQFTAALNGALQTVTWSASAGTITAAGIYTPPATIPSPNSVTITATGPNNTTATATVTILSNQPPVITGIGQSPLPIGVFSTSITGTGFAGTSQATLGGSALSVQFVSATQLNVSGAATQSGTANLIVSNGALASQPFPVQVGVANPQVSAAAARRFLEQAAFGPNAATALHVQQVGFQGWLNEQFALAGTSNYANFGSQTNMGPRLLANAVTNPDQLRQRVAFALSQIFVISIEKLIWTTDMAPYQQMLLGDAFVNFRQILGDVTLSPGMGEYLDMANNAVGNSTGTTLPNENYAREVLQLFTIGTNVLNPDGTPQVDSQGLPVPAYTQSTISNFARVFTGWTYPPQTGKQGYFGNYINMSGPMISYAAYHDTGAKTLLNGAVNAAGLSAQQDLNTALDNIFNHPNVGPFISKQLIQHLVKSNPTPGYVARVAATFSDNGSGVRGDMKAVITAILMDQEARQNDAGGQDLPTDGHLQEPALYLAGIFRALNGQVTDQNYFAGDLSALGQSVFDAPSVFNYYSPGYRVPGIGISGPEFQIDTPYTAVYRDNWVSNIFSSYSNPVVTYGPGTTVDLTSYVALASSPAALVNALDLTLTHGDMPSAMKTTLVSAVQAEAGGNLQRVLTALYLILTSSYYNVWH